MNFTTTNPCRCGYDGTGIHRCHAGRETADRCPEPADEYVVVAGLTALAGMQLKLGANVAYYCRAHAKESGILLSEAPEARSSESEARSSQHSVVVQKWEEIELGWGSRPDGFSLHLDEKSRRKYVDAYWATMPDEPPDEYTRPDGTPYVAMVDDKTYAEILAKRGEFGIRRDGPCPGDGGPDGWRPWGGKKPSGGKKS